MGILDDAIREHLELKRKHGAPEDELERQEEEALGPARREVAAAEAQDGNGTPEAAEPQPDAEPVQEAETPAEPVPESVPEVAPEPQHTAEEATDPPQVEPFAEPLDTAEPVAEPEPPAEPELLAEPEPEPEPKADHPPPEPPAPAPAQDTPPRGFEAVGEDELLADEELLELDDDEGAESDADADVLEDTPDFLQETPEHDRLWFEQKPPRDFDFD